MSFDAIAVIAGIVTGVAVAIISRLLLGPHAVVIGGSVLAASFTASAVTKNRNLKQRPPA